MERHGDLKLVQVVPASNPSFLALNPALTHVYAVNEDEPARQRVCHRSGLNGQLVFINSVPSAMAGTRRI